MASSTEKQEFLFSKIKDSLFEGDTLNAKISLPQRFAGKDIYWEIPRKNQFDSETSGLLNLGRTAKAKINLTARKDEQDEGSKNHKISFYTVKKAKDGVQETKKLIAQTKVRVEDLVLQEGDRGRLPITSRTAVRNGRRRYYPQRSPIQFQPAPQVDKIKIGKKGNQQYISLTFDQQVSARSQVYKSFLLKNSLGIDIPFIKHKYDSTSKTLKLYTGEVGDLTGTTPFSFEKNEGYLLQYRPSSYYSILRGTARRQLPFSLEKKLFVQNTVDGRNWLAFSGGGLMSHANISGFLAAALDRADESRGAEGGSLDRLMAPISGISALSGGAWFLSHLGYASDFHSKFDSKAGRDTYFNYQEGGYYGLNEARYNQLLKEEKDEVNLLDLPERIFWSVLKGIADVFVDSHNEGYMAQAYRYVRIGELLRFMADDGDDNGQWMQWRDIIDKYIYKPYGMYGSEGNASLLGKSLDERLPWLEDKDISFPVTLPNNDQTINGLMLYPGAKDAAFNKVAVSTPQQPLARNQFIDASFVSSATPANEGNGYSYSDYFHVPSLDESESLIFHYDPITPLEAGDALTPEDEFCVVATSFGLSPVCATTITVDFILEGINGVVDQVNRRAVKNNTVLGNVDVIDVATASSAAGGFVSMFSSMVQSFLFDYDQFIDSLEPGVQQDAARNALEAIYGAISRTFLNSAFVDIPSALDGFEYHFRQLAPLFSFAEGRNLKVDYIDELNSFDLLSEDFAETFNSKTIANQRQVRVMDGGYHDNTAAAHALHQIQRELSLTGELDDMLFTKSDDPTFELSIFAQSQTPTNELPHIPSNPDALEDITEAGNQIEHASGVQAKVPGDVGRLFGVLGSETSLRLDTGYQGDSLGLFFDGSEFFQQPKVQVFDLITSWSNAEPSLSQGFSYQTDGKRRPSNDNQIVIYELDVVTVDNELFGVRGGQKGRVNLIYHTNEDAMNMTTDADVYTALEASYGNIRDKIGSDDNEAIMNIFDWNVEYDLKDSMA